MQQPGERHGGKALPAPGGQFVQAAETSQQLFGQDLPPERSRTGHPGIGRNAAEIPVRQQALRQRRKCDESRTGPGRRGEQPLPLRFAVEEVVPVLEQQTRHVAFDQIAESEPGGIERIARNADIERLARTDGIDERPERLLERRLRIETVGIEEVHIVELHPPETLVEARRQVLPRSPVSVGSRPHVVAGLGGNEQFVAVRPERTFHDAAEGLFGRTVGRAVVVGQVEMRDAPVEGVMQHTPGVGEGPLGPEVLPKAERQRRQQHPAASGPPVGHPSVVTPRVGKVRGFGHES